MLIDAHCHLTELSKPDLEDTLARAHANGVENLIAIGAGYGFEDNLKTLEISKNHSNIYCALAMHPHDAKDVTPENFEILKNLCTNENKVRAVGEIGLDYHYMNSEKNVQLDVLNRFCELAKEIQKPVVIHDRACGTDCVDTLKNHGVNHVGGMVHCFTGDYALAQKYLNLDFYISFTGIITFKNSNDLREIVKKIPLEKMMIETDSPFLTPVPHRGKRNEPAFVKHVAECVATIKNISFENVCEITTKNAKSFFKI